MINKIYYTKDIMFLNNVKIYEYDISKANINILLYKGIISKEKYDELYNAPRMVRQKEIGIMQLDRKVYETLSQGIMEMRELFIQSNNLTDDDILSYKNDALFIINKVPQVTKFYNIEFKLKNIYTSFYKINKMEFYYYHDNINKIEKLDVKGISDEKLILHNDYLIDFLKALFELVDYNIYDAIIMFRNFYNQYVNNQLDIGYYRNFDPNSLFTINVCGNVYGSEILTINEIQFIDKNYNINFLRCIWQIITYIELNRIKGR